MDTPRLQGRNAVVAWIGTGVAAAALVAYFVITSTPTVPPGPVATPVTIGRNDPKLEFSDTDKEGLKVLLSEGKLTQFAQDSHEAWVSASYWAGLKESDRTRLVLLLASVNRDFDGTRQISVKETGTDRTVAEYFAGSLRVDP